MSGQREAEARALWEDAGPYLLFAGNNPAEGGWSDFIESTYEEPNAVLRARQVMEEDGYDWAEVVKFRYHHRNGRHIKLFHRHPGTGEIVEEDANGREI